MVLLDNVEVIEWSTYEVVTYPVYECSRVKASARRFDPGEDTWELRTGELISTENLKAELSLKAPESVMRWYFPKEKYRAYIFLTVIVDDDTSKSRTLTGSIESWHDIIDPDHPEAWIDKVVFH